MDSYTSTLSNRGSRDPSLSRHFRRFDENEDGRIDEKTKRLLNEWERIEKRAEAMRKETERLRAMKDDAKRIVLQNFPHLFRDSEVLKNENDISANDISSTSSSSLSSNEGSKYVGRAKSDKLRDRLGLSKDLLDVYEMLKKVKKMKNCDSVSDSEVMRDILKKREMFNCQSENEIQPQNFQQTEKDGALGQLLAKLQHENDFQFRMSQSEESQKPKEAKENISATQSVPPYGFIPMPVDYQTYCKWMTQFGPQGMIPGMSGHPPQATAFTPQPSQPVPFQPQLQPGLFQQQLHPGLFQQQGPFQFQFQHPMNPDPKLHDDPQPDEMGDPRYLGDNEDSEDTSQDAADFVSSHEEVKAPASKPVEPKQPEVKVPAPKPANPKQPEVKAPAPKPVEPKQMEVTEEPVMVVEGRPAVVPRSRLALPKVVANKKEDENTNVTTSKVSTQVEPAPIKNDTKKAVPEVKVEVKKPVQKLEVQMIGHPDRSMPIAAKRVEDDANFMLESDNNEENLYSSESDSTTTATSSEESTTSKSPKNKPAQKVATKPIAPQTTKPQPLFSSSPSQSFREKAPTLESAVKPKQPVAAIKIESDSDSPEIVRQPVSGMGRQTFSVPVVEDQDISGPDELDNEDDFWN